MMRQFLRMITTICTLVCAGPCMTVVYASEHGILLVKSSNKPVYNKLIGRFVTAISPDLLNKHNLSTISHDELQAYIDNDTNYKNTSLIITVGTMATQKVFDINPSTRVLSTLVPKFTYNQLLRQHGFARKDKGQYSAIYIDQPIERQLRYIRKLLPDKKNMGVLLGPSSRNDLSSLKHFARKYGYKLNSSVLDDGSYLPTPARDVFKQSQLMLARPDSYIYNPQHSKWLLYSSYKYRVPFIAYSESFVKAGALAAMHSTPEQMGQQLAEIVGQYLESRGKQLKGSVYPKYYKISINTSIARSLGIPVPDLSRYENRIAGEASR